MTLVEFTLAGKVGSGCSTVTNIIQQKLNELHICARQPGEHGFTSDYEREIRTLYRYYNWHQRDFHVLRSRDIITSFLFEDDAWTRLSPKNYEKVWENIFEKYDKEIELIENNEIKLIVECLKGGHSNISERIQKFNEFNLRILKSNENSNAIQSDAREKYLFITKILPVLGKCIHDELGKMYTPLFQQFGNELRFFGTLSMSKRAENLNNQELMYKYTTAAINTHDCCNSHGSNNTKSPKELPLDTIYTIPYRINKYIKCIERPNENGSKEPVCIIVDSMKNIYESNFLRDRYSAYYLISVTKDEDERMKLLFSNKEKNITHQEISFIDYNERPSQSSKKLHSFVDCLISEFQKNQKNQELKNENEITFVSYLNSIKDKNYKDILSYCIPENGQSPQDKTDKYAKLLECMDSININNSWLEKEDSISFEYTLKEMYKSKGLTTSMCAYYYNILKDPLRVLIFSMKLHGFYLQDVENCIQNSDIFLTNNEPNEGPKIKLKHSIIRYISLMLHPGIVTPTPIERCMQLAFTAKANSGCISRQVGSVVTDNEYNILSLAWNDVPCGQVQCINRNLIDLYKQLDHPAYSDYEWNNDSDFHKFLSNYDFCKTKIENVLKGLPGRFCFKEVNEDMSGQKNPMEARSMHGEERALMLCDKDKARGGFLFTTSSPCHMCAKNAKEHKISRIYYIEPYPGISQSHVCNSGSKDNRAQYVLFEGAVGRAYSQLYTPIIPYKDELSLRGFPINK